MIRYYISLLCLLSALFMSAQNRGYNPYEALVIGQQYFLLANNVNVRAAANTDAPVKVMLPIGTSIVLEAKTNNNLTIKGITAPWYQVRFTVKGKAQLGYVWAGFIALGELRADQDPTIQFLYGASRQVYSYQNNTQRATLYMQLRVCSNKKEIAKTEFASLGLLSTGLDASIDDNKGVGGVENILNFSFNDGYCGGALGMQVIFWDGRRLHAIRLLDNSFDAPYFKHQYFIYPNDQLGISGMIILQDEEGKYGEDGQPEYSKQVRQEFRWNAKQLEPINMLDR